MKSAGIFCSSRRSAVDEVTVWPRKPKDPTKVRADNGVQLSLLLRGTAEPISAYCAVRSAQAFEAVKLQYDISLKVDRAEGKHFSFVQSDTPTEVLERT